MSTAPKAEIFGIDSRGLLNDEERSEIELDSEQESYSRELAMQAIKSEDEAGRSAVLHAPGISGNSGRGERKKTEGRRPCDEMKVTAFEGLETGLNQSRGRGKREAWVAGWGGRLSTAVGG